jgi:leucyl aminopeptidase
MTDTPTVRFVALDADLKSTEVMLVETELVFGPALRSQDKASDGRVLRACKAARFTGARKTAAELLAPAAPGLDRILLIGRGDAQAGSSQDWIELGGYLAGQLATRRVETASVVCEGGKGALDAAAVADLALGAVLRSYSFRKYKTRGSADNGEGKSARAPLELAFHCKSPDAVAKEFVARRAIGEGVWLARDLVNEPANTLGPVEFAERASELADLGVEVEVLDVPQLEALKMGALLGVAQGSVRPARLVVMQWLGADNKRAKPIAFVGKGVVFDTGGISMKPAKGMEEMKGDMGGAACVTGLMHALAGRKAHVNAVGIIGLVENMPSGNAQRPGDIVTSMSGQTIEVLNTDAEGRLVLADALHYCLERFRPKAVIDLATLTGAIMVALGKEYAGLFCNNDRLANWLREAGEATAEKLWRMPIDAAYDREIDSKTADMKNIGGQYGGACTAAAFLKRFVDDTPWAHLDIAGTAMGSNRSEINESWGSGYGVRLLDRLVADHYEG